MAFIPLGNAYQSADNYVESLRYSLEALRTAEALKEDGQLMVTLLNRLGMNYYSVRYFEQALGCFRRALALARNMSDTTSAMYLQLNISDALNQMGKHRESLDSLATIDKKFVEQEEFMNTHFVVMIVRNYISLEQLDQARNEFRQMKELYRRKA